MAKDIIPPHREGMGKAADDVLAAEYPYWGALLTFNGVIVAIFSALAINGQQNRWIIFLLVLFSLASSVLIILNFRDRRNWLHEIGKLFQIEPSALEETKQRLANESVIIHNRIHKREPWILGLLGIAVVLMLWLLFPKSC